LTAVKQRRTQDERSALTQQKLTRAAFELIRDHGFANFRVASVAKVAGISQGGQLHHFRTKDALTMAAIDYALDLAKTKTQSNLEHYSGDEDVVLALIRDSRGYYFSATFDVTMDVAKSLAKNSGLRAAIAELTLQHRRDVEEAWLGILLEQGWGKGDAGDLIAMTTSLVRGFALRYMLVPDLEKSDRLMAQWREMVYQTFGARYK
jgi:AcrR family transcriptional regulator